MPDALNLTQNYNVDVILPDLMWDEMSDTGGDDLLAALPLVYEDADLLVWDQYEPGYGLTSLRGLGGEPPVIPAPGIRKFAVSPGYYGERVKLEETEMTKSREPGTPNLPYDPAQRIGVMMEYQAGRAVNRVRKTDADLLLTGTFTNTDSAGRLVHTDKIDSYLAITSMAGYLLPKSQYTLGPSWRADPDNARPLNDLDRVKFELELGTSSRFGKDSTILCNPDVIVDLLGTKQIREAYKDDFGASISGPADLEKLFGKRMLPKMAPYDKGYYPTLADALAKTNFTRIIGSKSMIWLGTRPKGQKLGKFALTRNLGVSPPAGVKESPYSVSKPSTAGMEWVNGVYVLLEYYNKMPFRYELDVAFSGGPVVHFGSAACGLVY